jgi:hypothetical protein
MSDSTIERDILEMWFARTRASKWANRPSFTENEFEPYVIAIGQLLLAWNDLHERLASLFVSALGGGWVNRPLALWHAVRADGGKRNMLKTALAELSDSEKGQAGDKLVEEIQWILDHAQKLEDIRDDAAHTPLYRYPPVSSKNKLAKLIKTGVFPEDTLSHPRARKIISKNKDLLVEFEYARERIIVLRDYALAIDLAWGIESLPWPDRPKLPERKPSRTKQQKGARRQQRRPPRQPRSSE